MFYFRKALRVSSNCQIKSTAGDSVLSSLIWGKMHIGKTYPFVFPKTYSFRGLY